MLKAAGTLIVFGTLLVSLIFYTPVTQLGSGFLVGEGRHLLTYYDLVKEARVLKVKFPNQDDIEAELTFSDPASNLAILALKEEVKIKAMPLKLNAHGLGPMNEPVFTLVYPWTNTMEDQHVLIEGSTLPDTASVLVKLNMTLDPVHSGSPLFNSNQEVVGMVLLGTHVRDRFPIDGSHNFAIPALLLEKVLKSGEIGESSHGAGDLPRQEFILKSKDNIVLVEAG